MTERVLILSILLMTGSLAGEASARWHEAYPDGQYLIHEFHLNMAETEFIARSNGNARPYAQWAVKKVWTLKSKGLGNKIGREAAVWILTDNMRRMAKQSVHADEALTFHIRSRNDESGRWALEFLDKVAGVWKKLAGK